MEIVSALQALNEMKRIESDYTEDGQILENYKICLNEELDEIEPELKKLEGRFSCTTDQCKKALRIFYELKSKLVLDGMVSIRSSYLEEQEVKEGLMDDLILKLLDLRPNLYGFRSKCCDIEEYAKAIEIFDKLVDAVYKQQETDGEHYLNDDDLRHLGPISVSDEPINIVHVQHAKPNRD